MSRLLIKKQVKSDDYFSSLVSRFKEVKSKYDVIEKEYTTLKEDIKKYMIDNEVSTAENDGFTVKLQKVEKQSFDVENLINFGTTNGYDFVKLVETIDYEKLESLIYNGFISPKQLEPYQKINVQYRLSAK